MSKPDIVLIHGHWLGGWCWRPVAEILTRRGFNILAPTLTGLGDRAHLATSTISLALHIEDVVQACSFADIDRPLLVGHSYGAVVAAGAAGRLKATGLLCVDGFLLDPGQTIYDAYPAVRGLFDSLQQPDGMLAPPPLDLFGLDDAALRTLLAKKLRPTPAAPNHEALQAPALHDVPRAYLRFRDFPVFAETASRAQAGGWDVAELAAGHMAILTHAEQVAAAIAARA
jgi:pimeloyl-ACP methyl ester carboxylesterase